MSICNSPVCLAAFQPEPNPLNRSRHVKSHLSVPAHCLLPYVHVMAGERSLCRRMEGQLEVSRNAVSGFFSGSDLHPVSLAMGNLALGSLRLSLRQGGTLELSFFVADSAKHSIL